MQRGCPPTCRASYVSDTVLIGTAGAKDGQGDVDDGLPPRRMPARRTRRSRLRRGQLLGGHRIEYACDRDLFLLRRISVVGASESSYDEETGRRTRWSGHAATV